MKCQNCGRENADVHNYCIQCGAVLPRPAVKAVRRRMGFFKRLALQIVIIILLLAGVLYWLSAENIIVIHQNNEGAYTAFFAFVGRPRLYLADAADAQFSEQKAAQSFEKGVHTVRVRLDACHYGFGGDRVLEIVLSKTGDNAFAPLTALLPLPEDGCISDQDVTIIDSLTLIPGEYTVKFLITQAKEQPVELKSITFSVIEPQG
jgi:hypothetical protein